MPRKRLWFSPESRRVEESGPEEESLRWHNYGFALGAFVGAVFLCYLASIILPGIFGHAWVISRDVWWTTNSAQWVSYGAFGTLYRANPFYSALPGFLLLYAPVVALGDHLGLVTGYPLTLPEPSMWLVSAPFFFVTGATAILGLDYLADTMRVSRVRRKALALGTALLVVVPTSFFEGHPEDLLALALSCLSLSLLFRSHYVGAAWVLAVAISMQTWAVLLLPILVAASPAGQRVRATMRAAGVPALMGIVLLALDYRYAAPDLLGQPMVNLGQHLPWWHFARHMTVRWGSVAGAAPVHATAGSSTRFMAVIVAIVLARFVWSDHRPVTVLAAAGLAMFARGLFEVEIWPYYLAPAAVLLVLLVAVKTPGNWRRFSAGAFFALVFYGCSAGTFTRVTMPSYVALGILLASAGALLATVRPRSALQLPTRPMNTSAHRLLRAQVGT